MFFQDLAIMIDSFRRSLVTLWWALVLIAFTLLLFALIFHQGLSDHLYGYYTDVASDDVDAVRGMFGTVPLTVLTLYEAAAHPTSCGIDLLMASII